MPLRWAVCLFRPPKGTALSLEVHPAACPAELHDQLAIRGSTCLRPRGAHILYERVDDAGQGAFTPPVLIYIKRLPLCHGLEVCIKRTLITHFVGRAIREAHLQVQLNHPHLLPAYASVRGRHHYYLVLPAAEGDLWAEAEAMRQHGTGYSEDELRAVARQMLMGLEHLHSSQLAHRDIKPANLLRLPDGRVVIADFGCADGCTAGFVAAGTTQFQPPECRRHANAQLAVLPKGYDQRSQDMWSVGATLACLWFARMPEVIRGGGPGGGGGGGGLSRNNSRGSLRSSGLAGSNSHHKRRSSGLNISAQPPLPLLRPLPPLAPLPAPRAPQVALVTEPGPPVPPSGAAAAPSGVVQAAEDAAAAASQPASGAEPGGAAAETACASASAALPVEAGAAAAAEPAAAPRPPRPRAASPAGDYSAGATDTVLPRFLAVAGFAGCGSTVGACGCPMSPDMLDLLSGLLQTRSAERLRAAQALQHRWLSAAVPPCRTASPTSALVAPEALDLASPPPLPSSHSVEPSAASSSSSTSPSKDLRGSSDGRFPPYRSIHYLVHRSSAPGDAPTPQGPPYDTPRDPDDAGDGSGGSGSGTDADLKVAVAARRARRGTADPDVRPEDLMRLHHRQHHQHCQHPKVVDHPKRTASQLSRGAAGGAAAGPSGVRRRAGGSSSSSYLSRYGSRDGVDGPSSYDGPSSAGPTVGAGGSGASGGSDRRPARPGSPSPRGTSPGGSGRLPPHPPLPQHYQHHQQQQQPSSSSASPWLRPNLPANHLKLSSRRTVLRVFVGAGSEASGST